MENVTQALPENSPYTRVSHKITSGPLVSPDYIPTSSPHHLLRLVPALWSTYPTYRGIFQWLHLSRFSSCTKKTKLT